MTPVAATTGLSTGAIVLIGGAIIVVGVIIYINKKQKNNSLAQDSVDNLSTNRHRYKTDKSIVEDAIREKDWETLEDMLDSRTSDFPDLIQMIKKALNNR